MKVKVDRAADEKETAKKTIGVEIRQNKEEIIRLNASLMQFQIISSQEAMPKLHGKKVALPINPILM